MPANNTEFNIQTYVCSVTEKKAYTVLIKCAQLYTVHMNNNSQQMLSFCICQNFLLIYLYTKHL
jgi:hypothetical protein